MVCVVPVSSAEERRRCSALLRAPLSRDTFLKLQNALLSVNENSKENAFKREKMAQMSEIKLLFNTFTLIANLMAADVFGSVSVLRFHNSFIKK